jgi:hypothetical protein
MNLLFAGLFFGMAFGGIASRQSPAPMFIIVGLFIMGIVVIVVG